MQLIDFLGIINGIDTFCRAHLEFLEKMTKI